MKKSSDEKKINEVLDNIDIKKIEKTLESINKISANLNTEKLINTINMTSHMLSKECENVLSSTSFTLDIISKTVDKVLKTTTNTFANLPAIQSEVFKSINNATEKISNMFSNQSNKKTLEYINLTTNIVNNEIKVFEKYKDFFINSKNNYDNSLNEDSNNYSHLKFQVEAVPKFVSYAYSEKSKVSIAEGYDSNIIKEINDLGDEIGGYIINIQKLHNFNNPEKKLINDGNIAVQDLLLNIHKIADSRSAFNELISLLYMGLYESTNYKGKNIIYALAKENEIDTSGMDLIKWFRMQYQHTIETNDKKNLEKLYIFIEKAIKKKIPEKPAEFVRIQHSLYLKIASMLKRACGILNVSKKV